MLIDTEEAKANSAGLLVITWLELLVLSVADLSIKHGSGRISVIAIGSAVSSLLLLVMVLSLDP